MCCFSSDKITFDCFVSRKCINIQPVPTVGVWQYLWQLINSYEETSLNDFSVTAGPIFDADHDSRFDPSSASKRFEHSVTIFQ